MEDSVIAESSENFCGEKIKHFFALKPEKIQTK